MSFDEELKLNKRRNTNQVVVLQDHKTNESLDEASYMKRSCVLIRRRAGRLITSEVWKMNYGSKCWRHPHQYYQYVLGRLY